jgi:small subunit ribosomal protein S4
MGFASSRAQARQLVGHGHFAVNGRSTNIPSYRVREGDRVEVRPASQKTDYFKHLRDALAGAQKPDWVDVDAGKYAGTVTALPRRDQMPLELNEQLVVEYYSR